MCFPKPKTPSPIVQHVAAADNAEALQAADIEQRLRRRRAGVAADILTGPTGIPATPKMGNTAVAGTTA